MSYDSKGVSLLDTIPVFEHDTPFNSTWNHCIVQDSNIAEHFAVH